MARGVSRAAIAVALLCAVQASADPVLPPGSASAPPATTFPPAPKFSFKRIGVPKPGTKKFITVQIDPIEQAAVLAASAPVPANPIPRGGVDPALVPSPPPMPAAPLGSYRWFWDRISPNLADQDGRFPLALASLTQGPNGATVSAPRLQTLQDIAAVHGSEILAATVDTRVSPALVVAVISVESAGRVDAVSSAGAVGLMQLIPATADRFAVADRTNPVDNIKGGVAYLDWLMKEFNGDPLMVLAAYNAGENAVKGSGGVPAISETRDYVPKVLAAWAVARGLCVTPPELVSDGCVFTVKG